MRTHLRPLAAVTALLASRGAWACAVCGQAAPENQWAYLVMTGILSVLPLVLMTGVAVWVGLRMHAAARDQAPVAPPSPSPAREGRPALQPSLDPSRP